MAVVRNSLYYNSAPTSKMSGGKRSDIDVRTDAEDYVESIMAPERVVRVDTPQSCGRKCHRSVPSGADITISLLDSVVVSPSS